MKVTMKTAPEPEVIICCPNPQDLEIQRIIKFIEGCEKIPVQKSGETVLILPQSIYYAETVDDKLFLYTEKEVYECRKSLTALCAEHEKNGVFRCAKNMAVGISHISRLKSEQCGKILISLESQEKILVSRSYAAKLRRKLSL